MKRFALIAVGMVIGFVSALGLLPAAQGANDISTYRQLNLFSDAFERTRMNYVRPTQDDELISAAIQGMVSNLDPHSSYMDRKSYTNMQTETRGEFGGIGIEIQMEDGLIKVVAPIDDTPAAKAGIKPADYIAAINGTAVQGMSQDEAVEKIKGPVGSKVTITVLRKAEKKPFDVTLTRAIVRVQTAKFRREGDVGYIRLTQFTEQTAPGLENAVRELKKQIGPGIKGYILDLRNNPGGLLDQAIQVSDDLLNRGEVVSTRGRHAEDTQRYDAKAGDITDGKPVIVLVNAGSASASEIVAGALQDHKRATVLGMTSFGKGSVQTILPLGEGGGALRLTTARYYTPSGHSIQAQGIIPDIQVAQGDEDETPRIFRNSEADLKGHLEGEAVPAKKANAPVIRAAPGKKYDDFQLAYALDLLNGKMTVAVAKPTDAVAAATPKAN
jgi:carboxyl-terminal processing protease